MGKGTGLESGGLSGGGCSTAGCERPHKAMGLCNNCYKRKLRDEGRTGTQRHTGHWGKWKGVECSIEGCSSPASAKGLCRSCYGKESWRSGKHRLTEAQKRSSHLKYRYGISTEIYDTMLAAQAGVCAICRQPPSRENSRAGAVPKLYVDHCHGTNRVRGLLCNHCNLAIGYAKTEVVLLAAADYVRDRGVPDC